MILAAGRGKRLRPLTDAVPKPLLRVRARTLISFQLEQLAKAGFSEVVMNVWYLKDQIQQYLGSGEKYGLQIHYSEEEDLLNTGGGIFHALNLLGDAPFLVVNCDVWTEYPFERLRDLALAEKDLAHLVLVDNPDHHPQGDFGLKENRVCQACQPYLTYSGIGVFKPELWHRYAPAQENFPLIDLLKPAIASEEISGEHYSGKWIDVGTLQRLQSVNKL